MSVETQIVRRSVSTELRGGRGASNYELWLAAGNVGTLEDYLAFAESALEPIAEAAAASAAALERDKWERLFTALAGGKVAPGILRLADDYGITDYENHLNLLFYWTGAIVWPLIKIEAGFDWRWADGGILHVEPNGDFYHSISIPLMNDPALDTSITLTVHHSDYDAGTNDLTAGRGDTAGNPWRTAEYAMDQIRTAGVPFDLYIHGDLVGITSLPCSAGDLQIPDGLVGRITFVPKLLPRTWVAPQRDSITKAAMAWSYLGDNTWECAVAAAAVPDNAKKAQAAIDALNVDPDGCATPVRYLAPGASLAATRAAVKALPGSMSWYGTTGVGLAWIVHLVDGREPDPKNFFHAETTQNFHWEIGEGSKLFLNRPGRFAWTPGAVTAAIRAKPIVVNPASRVVHTGEFYVHDFMIAGSSGEGIQLYDLGAFAWDYGVIKRCVRDAEQGHSFYVTDPAAGSHVKGWSVFLKAEYIGTPSPWGGAPASNNTTQISSFHDQIRFTRLNQRGAFSNGSSFQDVLGAQTLSINCHGSDQTQGTGLGPPYGTGNSPLAGFVVDGAGGGTTGPSIMRMLLCSTKVPTGGFAFSALNGGAIVHARQIGDKSAETYAGGTVTDND